MNIFDLAAKITLDSKGYEKGLNAAKSAMKGTGQVISTSVKSIDKLGKQAMNTYTALTGAAVAGVGALIKSATDGYANFEQLVGGVETLFGAGGKTLEEYAAAEGKTVAAVAAEYDMLMRAQQNIMDNAASAYKTAGLSANEYMETVTSFSASLIQSLDGDTETAAKLADQAIVDMSDNANKMGTDMSLIQNAYQGFAKANYTMLDNLKLGYGGTQTEMKRLIKDAAKLDDSVDASSMSFDNIVRAIHAVQTEMGITGTTAKEAATTIQGSAASMKAAWSNLMTGLADDTQDVGKLTDQLIDSVYTYADNLLPRVEITFDSIVELIEDRTEQIGGIVGDVLLTVAQKSPSVISAATKTIQGIAQELLKRKGDIKTAATTLFSSFLESFDDTVEVAMPLIEEFVPLIAEGFISYKGALFNAGIELIMAIANGLSKDGNAEKLAKSAATTLTGLVGKITDNLDPFLDAGLAIVLAIGDGLIENSDDLITGAVKIVDSLVGFVTENADDIIGLGVTLISSLATGLGNNMPTLLPKAVEMVTTLTKELTKPENILKMLRAAATLIKGLAQGLWNSLPTVLNNIPGIVGNVGSSLDTEWEKIDSDAYGWGEDTGTSFLSGLLSSLLKPSKELQGVIDFFTALFDPNVDMPENNIIANPFGYMWEKIYAAEDFIMGIFGGEKSKSAEAPSEPYAPPTGTTKSDGTNYADGGVASSTTNKDINVQMNIEIKEVEDPRALAEELSREMQAILEEEEDAYG